MTPSLKRIAQTNRETDAYLAARRPKASDIKPASWFACMARPPSWWAANLATFVLTATIGVGPFVALSIWRF